MAAANHDVAAVHLMQQLSDDMHAHIQWVWEDDFQTASISVENAFQDYEFYQSNDLLMKATAGSRWQRLTGLPVPNDESALVHDGQGPVDFNQILELTNQWSMDRIKIVRFQPCF